MKHWSDNDLDIRELNIKPGVDSLYFIGSLITPQDARIATALALHCKSVLDAKCITIVCPSIAGLRQDKNTTSSGEYNKATLNVEAIMAELAWAFDRMIVGEPHSGAAQYSAARYGMPFLPLSFWRVLTDDVLLHGIPITREQNNQVVTPSRDNTLIIRPDIGRNIAARRIQAATGYRSITCDKVRISATEVQIFLPDEFASIAQGMMGIMYDDEVAQMTTADEVLKTLQRAGMVAVALMVAYGKFIPGSIDKTTGQYKPGWKERIENPLLTSVRVTDARPPFDQTAWRHILRNQVTVEYLLREVIEADMRGVDFWSDPHFSPIVMQQNGEEDH